MAKPQSRIWEQKRARRRFRSESSKNRARTDLKQKKWGMAAGEVKPSLLFYFIIVVVAKW